ncbi:MAG: cellulose synthase subunit BcsC-related outer membrane protein [Hydrogenothermaceae bacterium]|nr:cellulose synthase subunit BcsC-related outer membrane protein [Hydrogenothermaceae bacterium]
MDFKRFTIGLSLCWALVQTSAGEESYELLVNIKTKSEEEKLKNLGFRQCKRIDTNTLKCLENKNLDYILQLKDFLKSNGLDAKISKPSTLRTTTEVKKEEKVKTKTEDKKKSNSLHSEKLSEASSIVNELINTKYSTDAKFIIGLVNLKRENFKEACEIFSSIKNIKRKEKKLESEACWVYYMEKGYNLLERNNVKESIKHFERSLFFKENLESRLGIFYAYLKGKELNKAQEIIGRLYSNYPQNKKVIRAYIDYLIASEKIQELSKFQQFLTEEEKRLLEEKNLYADIDKAKQRIESGELDEAESILHNLYLKQPSNIYVLLNLGYLYLLKGNLHKSENFYKNVLLIDKENKDAIKGLKAVYVKLGSYEDSIRMIDRLKALGVKDEDEKKIRELYLIKKAKEFIEKKEISNALTYAEEALKLNSLNPTVYLILSNIYKERGVKELYFKYLTKAYELEPEDFGIKVSYLYGLIDFEFFEQVKLILKSIDKNRLTEEQKRELRELYKVLYIKLSSFYLKSKDYDRAKNVALEGLSIFKVEPTLFELLGWSCYNLRDLECSKKAFENVLVLDKNNQTAILGLAYVYSNLKDKENTLMLLKKLENSTDANVLEGVATIYKSIGFYTDGERILKSIESLAKNTREIPKETTLPYPEDKKLKQENIQREMLYIQREVPYILEDGIEPLEIFVPYRQEDIKKDKTTSKERYMSKESTDSESNLKELKKKIEEGKQNYLSNLEIGLKLRDKSGENGKSKIIDTSPYILVRHFVNENISVHAGVYGTNLYSGILKDYEHFGSPSNMNIMRTVPSGYRRAEPFGGIKINTYKSVLEGLIGSTPIVNNGVSNSLIYNLEAKALMENSKIGIGLYRRPVRDSLLSYVGTLDPYTEKTSWGRAIEEGVKLSGEKGDEKFPVYAELKVGKIKGKNVQENNHYNLILMPKLSLNSLIGDKDYISLFFMYDSFSKDQDCYYYGCGGYFSPKRLMIAAPMFEGFKFFNPVAGMHYKAFLGLMNVDNKGENSLDTSFDGYIGSIYRLHRNIFLNISGEYRKTSKYSELFGSLSLQYFFGNRFNITEKDLINQEKEIYKK